MFSRNVVAFCNVIGSEWDSKNISILRINCVNIKGSRRVSLVWEPKTLDSFLKNFFFFLWIELVQILFFKCDWSAHESYDPN
jgi:hypothetical protein